MRRLGFFSVVILYLSPLASAPPFDFLAHLYTANKQKKESDDGSDESAATRSLAVRRRKEQQTTHRWSHVKISFDDDSVRLEPEQTQQPIAGVGSSTAASGIPTSSSVSAAAGPSTVPPTIKIIGKEVSRIRQNKWAVTIVRKIVLGFLSALHERRGHRPVLSPLRQSEWLVSLCSEGNCTTAHWTKAFPSLCNWRRPTLLD